MRFYKRFFYLVLVILFSCKNLKSREFEVLSDEAWKKNESQLALEYIEEAIRTNQKEGRLHLKKSLYLQAERRYKEALNSIEIAILNSEVSDIKYSQKAKIYFHLNELDSSFFYHDLAIKSAKNPYKALVSRAETKFKLKQYESALEDVSKSLELNSENLSAYFLRGEIFLNGLQKPEIAIEDFSYIINSDSKLKKEYAEITVLALSMRGIAYFKLEDTTLACLDWKSALDEGFEVTKGLIEDFCK
jgi:tetratricopeptide (TPR) repeat protein